jgi:predicted Zn-dependent protease with MMP-like domain
VDRPPPVRRILVTAVLALVVGLGAASLVYGLSDTYPLRLFQGLAIAGGVAIVLGGAVILVAQKLAGWNEPVSEEGFDEIVERAERLAREGWAPGDDDEYGADVDDEDDDLFDPRHSEEDFQALVRSALDELPLDFHRALEHVAIVVSDGGRRRRAYGLYQGDTVARDYFHDRIVIFRDTLLRDFGHDYELLKDQVRRTVRHELAHHLGWDENGVRGLGL